MELRQLQAIVTVAEAGGVTKAARLLHLAQPAVTRHIQALEEELGVPLFERTRQGMTPTDAGDLMVERARRALREIEHGRAEVRPNPGSVSGIVTIGLLESITDIVLGPLVEAVEERHPSIRLRVLTAYSGHLQNWLDTGDVDLTLLYNLASSPSLSVWPLAEEGLWAVARPDVGLDRRRPVTWAQVWEHSLVLPVAGHGLRVLIDEARSDSALPGSAPIDPDISIEVNSMNLQKRFVLEGRGWTVLPASGVVGDVESGRLSGAPVVSPEISRSVVVGLKRERRTPPPVEAVATELFRVSRRLISSGRWPATSTGSRG